MKTKEIAKKTKFTIQTVLKVIRRLYPNSIANGVGTILTIKQSDRVIKALLKKEHRKGKSTNKCKVVSRKITKSVKKNKAIKKRCNK